MKKCNTRKLTFSALIAAGYIAIMYATQGFAFGPIQMRVATALYATSYLFPFLVAPLALANMLSNTLMGGLGIFDIAGGLIVGLVTAGLVALPGKFKRPMWLVIPPIILAPAFIVSVWLSYLFGLPDWHLVAHPYWAMVINLALGQTPPAILGYILIKALSKRKAELSHE